MKIMEIIKETTSTASALQAATLLGICRASVYKAIRRGELPAVRVGGRILVLRSGLDRLLALPPEANEDGR